ncbi:hypothetical protein OSB04_023241 [Centaurea solstitialis]|uniref:Reverse transcriptase domain-containing protein n=1 Tax=Centaurea solstitialis TaxID=347529 RepID=A0AA38SKG0_9ASTR|nr:hypothetical protein OSB04_023241 [Centaurea solstitialis]
MDTLPKCNSYDYNHPRACILGTKDNLVGYTARYYRKERKVRRTGKGAKSAEPQTTFEIAARLTPRGGTKQHKPIKEIKDARLKEGLSQLELKRNESVAYLAPIVDKEVKEKRIQDLPVVRDYPEVFPKELPGLPLHRQVEFHIDLVLGVAPVAKSPYHLAPSKMQELSKQLQELLDKGLIRPSSSP